MSGAPAISVVLCTRDRGALLTETVRSILASDCSDFELLVVDQSDDRLTERALTSLRPRSAVRYERTSTRGLSRARNVGLELARAPLVAMTDDDCTVDPSWLREIVRAFSTRPQVALLFGNVHPASVASADGFIPAYQRIHPFLATGLPQKAHVGGMGACMAMRRDVASSLGGFDPQLGAGGAYRAGEEVDLTLRVLASNWWVYESPDIRVTHYGVRTWANGPACASDYWFGAGAAMGKHLRVQPSNATVVLARLVARFLLSRSPVANSLGQTTLPGARLKAFLQGLAAGVRTPVNAQGLFQSRPVPHGQLIDRPVPPVRSTQLSNHEP